MKKVTMVLGILAISLLFFCNEPMAQKFDLKMMTGPMGGSWYPLGAAIADAVQKEIPRVSISVSPGGGVGNVEAMNLASANNGGLKPPPDQCLELLFMRRTTNRSRRWNSHSDS